MGRIRKRVSEIVQNQNREEINRLKAELAAAEAKEPEPSEEMQAEIERLKEQLKKAELLGAERLAADEETARFKVLFQTVQNKAWVRMVSMIKERDHGLDQFELVINKKIVKGELVHHIVPLEDSPDRRLDPGNLIYVSRKSHRRIHDTYQKGEKEKEMLQKALFSAI